MAALASVLSTAVLAASPVSAASTTICSTIGGCQSAGRSTFGWESNLWASHWGAYAGHNCTNYVAYRLITTNGMSSVGSEGNASTWGTKHAAITNQTPARGSVAWWDANAGKGSAGHVAYVEDVLGNGSIIISEDSWDLATNTGNVDHFAWKQLTPGAGWPTGFIHFQDTPGGSVSEGEFISYAGNVYRIAGGAPLYVSSWANLGGERPTRPLSDQQFAALPTFPRDGTLISGQAPGNPEHGTVYVIAGGAPTYLSDYAHIGGDRGTVGIDLAAIHNAGAGGVWDHLRYRPADGTLISGQAPGNPEHGTVYVIAGGAPTYLSDYAHIGGDRGTVGIDLAAIHNAGAGGVWDHLRYRPADGTLISGQAPGNPEHGTVYVIAGGAPTYLSDYAHIGGDRGTVGIDLAAIHNAGAGGVWDHLRYRPADGTLISGQAPGNPEHGTVYVIAGGAPTYLSDYAHIGGDRGTVGIDLAAIHNAGAGGVWDHLRYRPADGTVLNAGTETYVVISGVPIRQSVSAPGTRIDALAVTNAGQPGVWSHLLAPPVTPPAQPTPTQPTPTSTPTAPAPTTEPTAATAATAPTAPTTTAPNRMKAPKVIVRGTRVIVKWKAAVPNGSAIARYLVGISKGKDKRAGASARKTVFRNLKPGRYKVRIAASNAIGTSPYSAWVKFRIR